MNKSDRLLIGALVLGVWALVAMQFFGGMTASAAQYTAVEVLNWPELQKVEVQGAALQVWPVEVKVIN